MIWYLIILLLLFVIWFISQKVYDKTNYNKIDIIKILVRQAARWSTAASQDSNVMIAILHANYGAGYLWAVRDIATDDEIKDATGINVLKFRDEIINIQDKVTRRMIQVCPNYAPVGSYLVEVASEQ